VKIALAVVAVVLGWVGAARAQPASLYCQTFTRASAAAPEIVRGWLARSSDDHVIVCTPHGPGAETDATPLYTGESAVTKRGTLCSYSSHGLTKVGTGAASRLQRYERADAVGMALAGGDCPAPPAAAAGERYTTTYDLSPAAFVQIMEFWAAAAASVQSFDRELACCDVRGGSTGAAADTAVATATRQRLRVAIEAGRMKTATVTRIVRISGRGMRRRYALFVADPDSRPAGSTVYVIYLSRWLGGPYHITGVTDAAS
jgi:hypothetical protein